MAKKRVENIDAPPSKDGNEDPVQGAGKKLKGLVIVLHFLTMVGCLVGFIFNSSAIFNQYSQGATVTSMYDIPSPDGFEFPVITFCNKSGFKKSGTFTSFKEYRDNTMKLEDFFLDADHRLLSSLLEGSKANPEVKTINTMYRGRCYSFYFKGKNMKNDETTMIKVRSNLSLQLSITHPGTEIFLIYDLHPWEMMDFNLIPPEMSMMDIMVSKNVRSKLRGDNCMPNVLQIPGNS